MTKRVDRRLQKAVGAAIGTRERKVERIPGFLGTFVDGEKTIRVPNRKDFVFVRLRMDQSEVVEAFNDQVADNFGTPVTVIRDPSAPRFYRVISREIAALQDWGSPYLINHAEQHMFAGGTGTVASDVVWIYRRAFVPLGVSPNGSMAANVASDYFAWDQGIKHFGPTGTVDFSAIRDSLGTFEARFITVLLNGDDSELNYVTGEIFDNTLVVDDPTEFIALPDPNVGIPLAAIYLFNSMTEVLWDNIFDIRQIIQGIGGSAGGSGVNWENVIIVAKSGGDHNTITAALAVAVAGDIILVMPGTYAESITLIAGVTVVGTANSTDPVILAPAAGTVVTIPSDAGTYRLHNCTLTPPSSTATVTDNMGASGLATLYRVSIGTSGGGDSIDSSGGNASATLTLEECRLSGNFTQFSICDFIDCISTSAINPAVSAGDLTIYGGEIAAEVDDVAGQTVAFHNVPFIGGAVTGDATLFGTYLDGSNILQVTNALNVANLPVTRIPYIDLVTAGLFTSSGNLTYNELAVTIRSDSQSNPRGIHLVQSIDTSSAGPQWTSSRSRGSLASPTAVQSGNKLGEFRFRGFDTNFTETVAEIRAAAAENFITGSHGSELSFFTTPNGTEILTEVGRFTQAGRLEVFITGSDAGIALGSVARWYETNGDMHTPNTVVLNEDQKLEVGSSPDVFTFHSDVFATSVIGKVEVDADTDKNALIDFNPRPSDDTKNAEFRFFRDTNTNGIVRATFKAGDGSNTTVITLGVNGSPTIFNQNNADVNFQVRGDTELNLIFADAGLDRVSIGASSPLARLHVDQSGTTTAIPVLLLDQADVSEEMIQFASAIGTGNAIEAVGAKTLTVTHFIKVTLPGSLTRYFEVGTIA